MLALRPFQRYFDFAGRSGRAEYWQYVALTIAINWVASIVDAVALGGGAIMTAALLTTIPSLAAMTRRLHDRNITGRHVGGLMLMLLAVYILDDTPETRFAEIKAWLMVLIMLAYAGYIVVLTALPGDPDANDYGEPDDPSVVPPVHPVFEYFRAPPRPTVHVRTEDIASAIERLGKLREKGLLTDEEFDAEKRKLLAPAASAPSN